jgi:hypothetical protein
MAKDHKPKSRLTLYSCGGGGINLGSYFENAEVRDGQAAIDVTYVDTSLSNLHNGLDRKRAAIIEGVDGSGKVRKENASAISESIKKLLLDHPPGDLSVVVYTGIGGTGSVAGILIHSELLARGEQVISVIIGGEESAMATDNTVDTLKSLDAISQKRGKNVVFAYQHNDPDTTRAEVDAHVHTTIAALAVLASRQNDELDTRDIHNWINFSEIDRLDFEPALVRLRVFDHESAVEGANDYDVISVATLMSSPSVSPPGWHPDYSATGYCDLKAITGEEQEGLHYLLTHDVDKIYNYIAQVQAKIQERKSARKGVQRYAEKGEADDNGLVL